MYQPFVHPWDTSHHLWHEINSKLVTLAFKETYVINPWTLHNKYMNYLLLLSQMYFKITHIFWYKHYCADKITIIDFSHSRLGLFLYTFGFAWWNNLRTSIWNDFNYSRLGISLYRFCRFYYLYLNHCLTYALFFSFIKILSRLIFIKKNFKEAKIFLYLQF